MNVHFALVTDQGRQRENNEDAAVADPGLGVFAVADGMGGHIGGEVASHVALETLISTIHLDPDVPSTRHEKILLRRAMKRANNAVVREAGDRGLQGMGTTLTALRFRARTAIISHIGDTRAYLVRPDRLQQLTTDHTVVELLVQVGTIQREDAHRHPERHMLTQALGTSQEIEPDVLHVRVPRTARVLLSSDGLHDVVPEAEILELARAEDLDHAARELVRSANDHGGPDNVTVLLIAP